MAVNTYSLASDGNEFLSENFTVREFASRDGADRVLIDTELVDVLQNVRDYFGAPVTINSAYRTPSHNRAVGGASNSQHVQGTAADIVVSGVEPREVAEYIEYILPSKGGIGLYNSFVHVDVRENRSRWENFGSERVVSGFPGFSPSFISSAYKDKKVQTDKQAVAVLIKKGIITNPSIWYNGTWDKTDFKHLIIKVANYIS